MSWKTAGAISRQASQSMHVESTKKSPGTFSAILREARAISATGNWQPGTNLHYFRFTDTMFDNLQDKMDRVFKTLRGEASLNEWHIDNALKEIRVALLEADVHFKVVKEFTNRVREKAVDRKSTRLNSSHSQISYAVFCLKKK